MRSKFVSVLVTRAGPLPILLALLLPMSAQDGSDESGNAFQGNGTDARIVVPDDTRFNSPELTVEAWVRLDAWPTNDRVIVGKYHYSDAGHFTLALDWQSSTTGRWTFYFGTGGAYSASFSAPGPTGVHTERWYHLAGVRTSDHILLYIDGVEVASTAATFEVKGNNLPVIIGEYNGLFLPGQVDEVRIWDYARSSEEIACGIHSVARGDEPGLLLLLHMDETENATTVVDSSPFATDGTVEGGGSFVLSTAGLFSDNTCYDNDGDGFSVDDGDCDDEDPLRNPDAEETCDGVDNDCNGQIDEGVPTETYYLDADEDTFGEPEISLEACAQPIGYVIDNTDCDDGAQAIHPGAAEVCDSVDNDCDGATDEGLTTTYYLDADEDGFGSDTSLDACTLPGGYAEVSGDCEDGDPDVSPGVAELCNGRDDNCNDEADEGLQFQTYFRDADGDGFGTEAETSSTCDGLPEGFSAKNGDCNDENGAINPDALEVCDEIDNDCSGQVDDDPFDLYEFFPDQDQDSYGAIVTPTLACTAPEGYVVRSGDCDDENPVVYPGAEELPDGADNDCDGEIDEGLPTPTPAPGDDDDTIVEVTPGDDDVTGDDDATAEATPGDDDVTAEGTPGDDDVTGDDDTTAEATPGDDDATAEATPGDDDTTVEATPGDDDTTVEATPGDDDTTVEATPGDDDTTVEATPGDDDATAATTPGDDDASGDDDTTSGDTPTGNESPTPAGGDEPNGGCECRQGHDSTSRSIQLPGLVLAAVLWYRRCRARYRD